VSAKSFTVLILRWFFLHLLLFFAVVFIVVAIFIVFFLEINNRAGFSINFDTKNFLIRVPNFD